MKGGVISHPRTQEQTSGTHGRCATFRRVSVPCFPARFPEFSCKILHGES
jgi:hypothetical protein